MPLYIYGRVWSPPRSDGTLQENEVTKKFQALIVTKNGDRQSVKVTELTDADLMQGDVTVAVEHSTLNYKDGLAITGRGAHYPQFSPHPRHRLGRRGSALRGSSLPRR